MDAHTAQEWGLDLSDRMVRLWGEGWDYQRIARHMQMRPQLVRLHVITRLARMEREVTLPKLVKWTEAGNGRSRS